MRCRGDDGSSTAPDGRRSPPGTTIDRAEAPDAGGSERVLLMAVEGRALREPASQFCAATRSISLAPRALRARIGGMADTEDPGRDAPDNVLDGEQENGCTFAAFAFSARFFLYSRRNSSSVGNHQLVWPVDCST
mmetsp:Transcript_20923/g.58569  ORF Transcript_20923/g.58569 Transcript_20923/m.58569 type:complete len:135 (-) Transcript_20923:186-590(-)